MLAAAPALASPYRARRSSVLQGRNPCLVHRIAELIREQTNLLNDGICGVNRSKKLSLDPAVNMDMLQSEQVMQRLHGKLDTSGQLAVAGQSPNDGPVFGGRAQPAKQCRHVWIAVSL